MRIAFYGSSLLSGYWNGAATYYRGLLRALHRRGYEATFYEPDAYGRQERRDIAPPDWCRVVVYEANAEAARQAAAQAAEADIVVKASGVGVFDDELLDWCMAAARPDALRLWWDVDAPATLAALARDPAAPLHRHLPALDAVCVYGGGPRVAREYLGFGARRCVPVHNGLDPDSHRPAPADPRFACDLALLANRLPDREARIHAFFLQPAAAMPDRRFVLGGAGWEDLALPANVHAIGHVATPDHNAFNATPLAVLNVNRDSMAEYGYSPPTRMFEAAGAGACLITDHWPGIEAFLTPGEEILVARDGAEVAACLAALTPELARRIGARARARMLREHSYESRAATADALFRELRTARQGSAPGRRRGAAA